MLARQQIPNLLTFARVAAVPICLLIILRDPAWKHQALLWIFIAAALTDFLDGYLARRWNVVSALGTMLDPIADKLLVALMLVFLLMNGHPILMPLDAPPPFGPPPSPWLFYAMPLFLPVAVILLRELYISGLREFLSARGIALPVSASGKWKTALQMIAIALLLTQSAYSVAPSPLYCHAPFTAAFSDACASTPGMVAHLAGTVGLPLLYLAALLSFTSAASYTRASWKHLR